jgi:hypothetical protein
MSSTETPFVPRPIDGTGVSGERTPISRAISATRSGPTSSVRRAYTELSDRSVADVSDVGP